MVQQQVLTGNLLEMQNLGPLRPEEAELTLWQDLQRVEYTLKFEKHSHKGHSGPPPQAVTSLVWGRARTYIFLKTLTGNFTLQSGSEPLPRSPQETCGMERWRKARDREPSSTTA